MKTKTAFLQKQKAAEVNQEEEQKSCCGLQETKNNILESLAIKNMFEAIVRESKMPNSSLPTISFLFYLRLTGAYNFRVAFRSSGAYVVPLGTLE